MLAALTADRRSRAAAAGKHLLLEKPIATSAAGGVLVEAVEAAQVASVVFFTLLFQSDVRAWLADVTSGHNRWAGADLVWLGSSLREFSPFNTPWRREKGGLWDLGPHAISLLWACLGPVGSVTADAGPADVAHLVLHHRSGATSTVTVSLSASAAAAGFGCYVWGEAGRSTAPGRAAEPVTPLRVALTELVANARSGQTAHHAMCSSARMSSACLPRLNGSSASAAAEPLRTPARTAGDRAMLIRGHNAFRPVEQAWREPRPVRARRPIPVASQDQWPWAAYTPRGILPDS